MDFTRSYRHHFDLKYGCNPHQQPASVLSLGSGEMPFSVLNGKPGYINLLDALNAWQLVRELDEALELPAAASFKHVSPAGAAVAVPLNDHLSEVYGCNDIELSPLAAAYVRARGADPLSSFGDWIALSRDVDEKTANIIRPLVSDGIIAPGYTESAFALLSQKKGGNFNMLQANTEFNPPPEEFREIHGAVFRQQRNSQELNDRTLFNRIVTRSRHLPESARRDLILAAITIKYTQSNSVGYALDGQMIGIGAGQQSRVDCTKLAGRKSETWFLRQHPRVRSLPFREEVKEVERTNARIGFIEGEMTPPELEAWRQLFKDMPQPLSSDEKKSWLNEMEGVSLASDAFFPFRDNIDQASRRGVRYLLQPGGSMRDDSVIAAADDYGMVMAMSGIRLFHH